MTALVAALLAVTTLSLDDSLRIAREQQPALRQARAAATAAEARADGSRAALLPQVTAAGAWSRTTNDLPADQTADRWSQSASVDQVLFDAGTFSRWRGARASSLAARHSARDAGVAAAQAVRNAWFDARGGKARVAVARDSLANQDRHLEQVQIAVKIGTRPEIDAVQIRAERANVRVALIRAENAYRVAIARLLETIGMEASDADVADEWPGPVPGERSTAEVLRAEAIANSPSLAAAEADLRSARAAKAGALSGFAPRVSADASLTRTGAAIDELEPLWGVGVSFSWPLFRGLGTYAAVRESDAGIASAAARRDGVRLAVLTEAERARLDLQGAAAALAASEEALVLAAERLRLAEARYATGSGSAIELGDAQTAHTAAAGQRVDAEQILAIARAELVAALGRE